MIKFNCPVCKRLYALKTLLPNQRPICEKGHALVRLPDEPQPTAVPPAPASALAPVQSKVAPAGPAPRPAPGGAAVGVSGAAPAPARSPAAVAPKAPTPPQAETPLPNRKPAPVAVLAPAPTVAPAPAKPPISGSAPLPPQVRAPMAILVPSPAPVQAPGKPPLAERAPLPPPLPVPVSSPAPALVSASPRQPQVGKRLLLLCLPVLVLGIVSTVVWFRFIPTRPRPEVTTLTTTNPDPPPGPPKPTPAMTPRFVWNSHAKPVFLTRIRSVEAMGDSVQLLGNLVNQKEMIDQMLKGVPGLLQKGFFEAIDLSRPCALYGAQKDTKSEYEWVALVPIKSSEHLLELFRLSGGRISERGSQLFVIDQLAVPQVQMTPGGKLAGIKTEPMKGEIFCRLAEGYAYFAEREHGLTAENRIPPTILFSDRQGPLASFHYFPGNHSSREEVARLRENSEKILAQVKSSLQGNPEPIRKAQLEILRVLIDGGLDLYQYIEEVALAVDLPQGRDTFEAELFARPTPGTALARQFADFERWPSTVAVSGKPTFRVSAHAQLPARWGEALALMTREYSREALRESKTDEERKLVEKLSPVLEAAAGQGELDFALATYDQPDHSKSTLFGLKLPRAKDLESALKLELPQLHPASQKRIQFDLEKVGNASIHRADVAALLVGFPEEFQNTLGNHPVYYAFRPEEIRAAHGSGGLARLKEALSVPPAPAPLFLLEAELKSLLSLGKVAPDQQKVAAEVFRNNSGRFRISLEGGEALRLRHSLDLSIARFVIQIRPENPVPLRIPWWN